MLENILKICHIFYFYKNITKKLTFMHRNSFKASKLLTTTESEPFASSSEAITVISKNSCPALNRRSHLIQCIENYINVLPADGEAIHLRSENWCLRSDTD